MCQRLAERSPAVVQTLVNRQPGDPELHCERRRDCGYPSGPPTGMSGYPTGHFRMAAPLNCPRCGHTEWRYAGMLQEAPGRKAIAWRCVACNWPRLNAPADVRPVRCATCHEMNRTPRFADWFTCWNCDEDSLVP